MLTFNIDPFLFFTLSYKYTTIWCIMYIQMLKVRTAIMVTYLSYEFLQMLWFFFVAGFSFIIWRSRLAGTEIMILYMSLSFIAYFQFHFEACYWSEINEHMLVLKSNRLAFYKSMKWLKFYFIRICKI